MLINRRLYRFRPDAGNPSVGRLILGNTAHLARKTVQTMVTVMTLDTMTGRKRVNVYYDEFESEEALYSLGGGQDAPCWTTRSPVPLR